MTDHRCPRRRHAFTLLEMVLAGAIGVLLLGALYVAMEVQVRQTQSARNAVEQAKLARALLDRMAQDLAPALGTPDPSRYRASSSSQGSSSSGTTGATGTTGTGASTAGTGAQAASTGGTTGASGTTASGTTSATGSGTGAGATGASGSSGAATGASSGSSGTSGGTSSGSSASTPGTSSAVVFAVQGDASNLTLYVNRLGRNTQAANSQAAASGTPPPPSDLRRVTYWVIDGGTGGAAGLARIEEPYATGGSDGIAVPESSGSSQMVAEEVRSLSFSYFDGTSWLDTWDGTTPGADGATPTGPPLAVAITVGLVPPGQAQLPDAPVKLYRHVVALPTANGATQVQSSSDGSSTTGSSSSGTSSSGTTGGGTSSGSSSGTTR